eukprot:1143140-Pelagomonas_calceolata.AAC.2
MIQAQYDVLRWSKVWPGLHHQNRHEYGISHELHIQKGIKEVGSRDPPSWLIIPMHKERLRPRGTSSAPKWHS